MNNHEEIITITIQMLQRQFDSEYDNALGKEENQVNGSSKVVLLTNSVAF